MHHLKLVSLALLMSFPLVVWGDTADCSHAQKWNSDSRYKKGEKVWYHTGGNSWQLYTCDKDECHGAGDNEPNKVGSTWKSLGLCSKDPS